MTPRKTSSFLLVALTAFWSGANAIGQDKQTDDRSASRNDSQRQSANSRAWAEPAQRWQKANDIIGKDVHVAPGDDVGDVDDLIIDMNNGRIIYYIVSIDDKQVAIPVAAMQLPADAAKFRLNSTKEQLKSRAFDKSQLPDFAARTWATSTHDFFKVPNYWKNSDDRSANSGSSASRDNRGDGWFAETKEWQKATDLISKKVVNAQSEDLGSIQDLAIDPDSGRVMFAVLSFGGFLGMGDKLFAIPWSSLQLATDRQKLVLNVEKDRLKNASGFDKSEWPNMVDRNWTNQLHEYYGQRPYWEASASASRDNSRNYAQNRNAADQLNRNNDDGR